MDYFLIFLPLVFFYLLVVWKAGKTYPILYLFIFTYFLQYVFATFLTYNEYRELSVQMAIRQEQYFGYTIPALLALFSGVLFFNKDFDLRKLLTRIDPSQANAFGYLLVIISYSIDLVNFYSEQAISSVASFTYFLKFLGAFCFLFSKKRFNYVLIVLVFLDLVVSVLRGGVFMQFFIWATYLFFFIALTFRLPFALRGGFIVIAMPVLIIIQAVKSDYREATWEDGQAGSFDLLKELAENEVKATSGQSFSSMSGVVSTVGRLSQGWHLGMTLKHVPRREPFADGREFFSDISSSLLPRAVFPDKKVVHSQDKFYQYTGHKLYGGTSMTIGILGDFYINFGWWGSIIGLFIFGAAMAKLLRYFIRRYVISDPINIIWIPFMLSYLIRADNDFYTFFNCLVKGFLIFIAVNYLRRLLWPAPLRQYPV